MTYCDLYENYFLKNEYVFASQVFKIHIKLIAIKKINHGTDRSFVLRRFGADPHASEKNT